MSFFLFCFVLLLFLLLRKIFTDCYVKKVKRKSSEMEIYDKYDSMGLSLHINLEENCFFLSFFWLKKIVSVSVWRNKQSKNKSQYCLLTPLVFSLMINFLLTHLVNMVYNKAKTWIYHSYQWSRFFSFFYGYHLHVCQR